MDSIKRADSSLSISSIVSDFTPDNDDPEITTKANSMLKCLMQAVSDTNAENSVLGSEFVELFNLLQFDVKSLPIDIREGLHATATILKSEGLSSLNETALQLCLEKKKIQSKMKEREERLLKTKYNTAFAKYNSSKEKLNQIRKEVEQLEDTLQSKISNDDNIELNRTVWSKKLHDYKQATTKLEQELESLQIPDIELDITLQKSSLLMDKLNNLTQLNNVLERYNELPPNLLQAQNILECKKRELEEIENLIHDKMND